MFITNKIMYRVTAIIHRKKFTLRTHHTTTESPTSFPYQKFQKNDSCFIPFYESKSYEERMSHSSNY